MRFDWEHLKNWIFGFVGAFAAIFLVVIAANSPLQSSSKPSEAQQSQSDAPAAGVQTTNVQPAPGPGVPQVLSITNAAAKASAPPAPAPIGTTPEAAKPALKHDHATIEAQAQPAAPAQTSSSEKAQPEAVTATAGFQGDAGAGRQVFKKCQACHSLEPGKTILGPSLAGIVGRKSASDANCIYSPALKQAGFTWSLAILDAYLGDPAKVIPGN